jgi:hypothetical protein
VASDTDTEGFSMGNVDGPAAGGSGLLVYLPRLSLGCGGLAGTLVVFFFIDGLPEGNQRNQESLRRLDCEASDSGLPHWGSQYEHTLTSTGESEESKKGSRRAVGETCAGMVFESGRSVCRTHLVFERVVEVGAVTIGADENERRDGDEVRQES